MFFGNTSFDPFNRQDAHCTDLDQFYMRSRQQHLVTNPNVTANPLTYLRNLKFM